MLYPFSLTLDLYIQFCDMITERIEKYEKRMSYDKGKLNN